MSSNALDVVVLLKLVAEKSAWNYEKLGESLGISSSQAHEAIKRLIESKLVDPESRQPLLEAAKEYLIHGVKYVFPAKRGAIQRGFPTSYAAPPLLNKFAMNQELPPVWPDPDGHVKGYSLEPLNKHVTQAIRSDPKLYELLALVDALRDGRARERNVAREEISKRLSQNAVAAA